MSTLLLYETILGLFDNHVTIFFRHFEILKLFVEEVG